MSDHDAARADLRADMQHAVTAEPCLTPTMRCPHSVAGGACAELLLRAAGGHVPVPVPTWITFIVGAFLGGHVTLVATWGARV